MDVATGISTLFLNAIAVVPPDFTSGFIGKNGEREFSHPKALNC